MSAGALASNLVFHACTKHIKINIHFVRDRVLAKKLIINHDPFADQVADCFMKALSHTRFWLMRDRLRVINLPTHLMRGVKT